MSDGGNESPSHMKGRVPMDASVRGEDPEFNYGLPPTFAEIEAMPLWVRPWVVRRLVEWTIKEGASVGMLFEYAPGWAWAILEQITLEESLEG